MSVISDFQLKHGLVPDGSIGKKTLTKIKEVLNIDTDEALAHFMGQCAHESANFTAVFENLNYSSNSLLRVFPRYFNASNVNKYQRQPMKIANKVYANRMGNGDEASGDGWKYRGMGFIQLTGKYNQELFADTIGVPEIKDNPELIATEYPFESAKFFFDRCKLWGYTEVVDENSILILSKSINLGNPKAKGIPNGLDDRIAKTNYYYNLLKS